MVSPTQWTWVWASSRRWWRTGRPGMLQSMGLQLVRYGWTTEQKSKTKFPCHYCIMYTCIFPMDLFVPILCFKFFLLYHFVFSVMSLYLLICLIILLECWTLCIKYFKGPGLWYPLSEKNRFYSVKKLEGRQRDRYHPASYLVTSFSNPFKDTGNPTAQWNREV